MPKKLLLLLAGVLAVVLAACGGDASSVATPTATAPAPSAPLTPALQKILDQVAGIRELSPPTALKVGTVTKANLSTVLDRNLTPEDRTRDDSRTVLYRLLGHLGKDEGARDAYATFADGAIVGLYSPVDKELWVVTDSPQIDVDAMEGPDKAVLAHELLHAIQDFHFDLSKTYDAAVDDLDRRLAWTAVAEGDAKTTTTAYVGKYLAALPVAPGGPVILLSVPLRPNGPTTPPSLEREFLFPYQEGADAIRSVRMRAGNAGVDALLKDTPAGTAAILHPDLLLTGWKPVEVKLPDLAKPLGSGWKRDSGGAFGEFQLRNYLQLGIAAGEAASAAAGWAGDHYDLYRNSDQAVAVFRVAFKDPAAATKFTSARQALLQRLGATGNDSIAVLENGTVTASLPATGATVTFVIGSERGAVTRALDALKNG